MAMTLDGIELPDGLHWADEFDWTPVAQEMTTTITGTLLVQEGAALAGRPITLKGLEESSWATRALVAQLYAMAQAADQVMSLSLGQGQPTKQVIWRRAGGSPLEAAQLLPVSTPESGDMYALLALRFLEAPPP